MTTISLPGQIVRTQRFTLGVPTQLTVGGIISMLRRLGIGAGMRVAVPGRDASEMISMIRCVVVSFIWGATTLGTLVIAKAAALPASATVIVVALELAGFCLGLLTARRTPAQGRQFTRRPVGPSSLRGVGGHRLILALGPGS